MALDRPERTFVVLTVPGLGQPGDHSVTINVRLLRRRLISGTPDGTSFDSSGIRSGQAHLSDLRSEVLIYGSSASQEPQDRVPTPRFLAGTPDDSELEPVPGMDQQDFRAQAQPQCMRLLTFQAGLVRLTEMLSGSQYRMELEPHSFRRSCQATLGRRRRVSSAGRVPSCCN